MVTPWNVLRSFWLLFGVWTVLSHTSTFGEANLHQHLTRVAVVGIGGLVLLAQRGWSRLRTDTPASTETGSARGAWVFLLALATGLCAALWHLPSRDDALYSAMAVSMVDHPDRPLLSFDVVHGLPNGRLAHPSYRLHSLEILQACLAWVFGQEPLWWAHVALPPIFGFALGLAWCLLLQRLAPRAWGVAYLFLLAFWVLVPQTLYSWFALLHLSKAILALGLLPFFFVATWRFLERPSLSHWGALLTSQIAAVGLGPTGLWFGPAALLLAWLTGLAIGFGAAWKKTFAVGALALLTTAYPLGLGASMLVEIRAEARAKTAQIRPPKETSPVGDTHPTSASARRAAEVPSGVATARGKQQAPIRWKPSPGHFREGPLFDLERGLSFTGIPEDLWRLPPRSAPLFLGAIALLLLFGTRVQRRFVAVTSAFVLALYNPYVGSALITFAIHRGIYWRVLWLLPGSLLVALACTLPLESRFRPPSRKGAVVGMTAVLLLCSLLYGTKTFLPLSNQTVFAPFSLRQPSSAWYGRRVSALVDPGSPVVVPAAIAPWLISQPQHAQPLAVRFHYDYFLKDVGRRETSVRLNLMRIVGPRFDGQCPPHANGLIAGLQKFEVRALAFFDQCTHVREQIPQLQAMGFQKDSARPPDGTIPPNIQIWWR